MSDDARPDRGSSGGLGLIVGVSVAILLFLALGFVAFRIVQANRRWTAFAAQAPRFAQAWVEDLGDGRLDAAYGATTAGFRGRIDREAFGRWAAEHPELGARDYTSGSSMPSVTGGLSIGTRGIRIIEPDPRVAFTAEFPQAVKGPSVLTLSVVGDAGRVSVDQAEFGPEATPSP